MSERKKVKRSVVLRLLAAVGWVAIKIAKVLLRLLALTGSRVAKKKLHALNERHASRSSLPTRHHAVTSHGRDAA